MAKSIQSNEKVTISGLGNQVVEIHDLKDPINDNDAISKNYFETHKLSTDVNKLAVGNAFSIGEYSFAVGYNKNEVGTKSIGTASLASGKGVVTYGPYSSAFGCLNVTGKEDADPNSGIGKNACAIGYANKAIGESSFAVGTSNEIHGKGSCGLGSTNKIYGYGQCALGYALIVGKDGDKNDVDITKAGKVAVGKYNSYDENSIFMVGNGSSETKRRTVFSIKSTTSTFKLTSENTEDQQAAFNHTVVKFDSYRDFPKVNYNDIVILPDGTHTYIEEIWDGKFAGTGYAFRLAANVPNKEGTAILQHTAIYLNEREVKVRPL